jgi:hypothetical protein
MEAQRKGEKTWLDVLPRRLITSDPNSNAPLFVDVGGSIGHQCAALIAAFPEINRKVILQDLPPVIAHALPTKGVENMVHDFWQPQPVKSELFPPSIPVTDPLPITSTASHIHSYINTYIDIYTHIFNPSIHPSIHPPPPKITPQT